MKELRAMVEAWLRHRVRSLYEVHARGYLILGLLGYAVLRAERGADRWLIGSVVWGIILLIALATLFEGWNLRRGRSGDGEGRV